jgi:hypothetical protein
MMMLAATLAFGTQPDSVGQSPHCPPTPVKISKIIEPQPDLSGQRFLPKESAKEPSVLLPTCKREGQPKKKEYPLA